MNLFAFFAPGPLELLLIGLACVVPVVAVVAIVIVLAASKKSGPSSADNPNLYPCPDCGRMVSRQAPACPQCGKPLVPEQD